MRFSVGTDIVDIEKLRGSFARWGQRLISRVLTDRENQYCRSKANFLQSVAGRIAAKEAIYKALYRHGVTGYSWRDIEILEDRAKAPVVNISERVADITPAVQIAISISHTERHAIAIAHIEVVDNGDL
jgi:holo-[acyl-carrier protein] synthase